MKNKKRWVFTVLGFIFALAGASGCKDATSDADNGENSNEEILYCDFENWSDGFELIRMNQNFGRVSVNTDKAYVKTGEQSARLDPLGFADYFYEKPSLYFPMKSARFNFDYSNFEQVESVEFSIYNAQQLEKEMFVGFVKSYAGKSWSNLPPTTFTLQPGWNECSLSVSAEMIELFGGKLENVEGVYFQFWNQQSMNVTENTDYYFLDNIRISKTDELKTAGFSMDMEEGEIAYFEKPWQDYMFTTQNRVSYDVVKASDYGIEATEGKHVLRTLWKHEYEQGTYNYEKTGGYQYILLSRLLTGASGLKNLNEIDADNVYVTFDFYLKSEIAFDVNFRFRLGGADKGGVYKVLGAKGKSNGWTTFECCAADLLALDSDFFKDPGSIEIMVHDNGVDREIFFDNIRIEQR